MPRYGGTVSTRPIDGSAYLAPGSMHAQVARRASDAAALRRSSPRRCHAREVVAVGILERALLLDREHLLPRGERRVELGRRELRRAATTASGSAMRGAGRCGSAPASIAPNIAQRGVAPSSRLRVHGSRAAKSAANERSIAAAISAKSSARNPHDAEAERRAPVRLAANERQLASISGLTGAGVAPADSRRRGETDGSRRRISALVDDAGAHAADRRERLQRRAVGVARARRIEREAVAGAHALERAGLAVIDLREAAGDGAIDVILRDDADPELPLRSSNDPLRSRGGGALHAMRVASSGGCVTSIRRGSAVARPR